MNRREHAAGAAAGELDCGEIERNYLCETLDYGALFVAQMLQSAPRKDEQFTCVVLQLEGVPGEVFNLLSIERDDGFGACFQTSPDVFARRGVINQIEADEGKICSETHHDIGVVDGPAITARALEGDRLKIEIRAEFLQRLAIGSAGKRDVGEPVNVVENEAAGAFEKKPAILVVRIIDHLSHAIVFAEADDEIAAALGAAGAAIHRIKRDSAVGVGRKPIVWENCIRLYRSDGILRRVNGDANGPKRRDCLIELALGERRDRFKILGQRLLLKGVIERRLGVRKEPARPDHKDGIGALFRHLIFSRPAEGRRNRPIEQRTRRESAFLRSGDCGRSWLRVAWPPAMRISSAAFTVSTSGKGTYEITENVARAVSESGVAQGTVTVFVRHTSCSLIIMENADPSARRDLEKFFERLVPEETPYFEHTAEGADDSTSHIRSVLTRSSEVIPIADARLQLGTWQGIFLFEHRRARHRRQIALTLIGDTLDTAPRAR